MRVLGIDCGTERTGYGIIESDGARHRMLVAGSSAPAPNGARGAAAPRKSRTACAPFFATIPLEAASVEAVFFAANARSALKLAHVRGVALLAVAEAGVALAEYSALEIKVSVVGYGRAEKRQVQIMVQSLLGLATPIDSEDASDALAAAICHATRAAFAQRLTAARPA